ncbi:serine--tRNA ligase [Candidatus Collierbacteria bacterium]|nr:serine--tRNA ligase [Candidatus Collierbacteria bacterium]
MLDIQFIRDYPEKVKKAIIDKQLPPRVNVEVVDRILELDKKRRDLILQSETIRRDRNELARRNPPAGGKQAGRPPEEIVKQGRELKQKLAEIDPELKRIENSLDEIMLMVPGVPADDVPVGKDEKDNVVVRTWGEPKFSGKAGSHPVGSFELKDHIELGQSLDILDVDRGTKVAGFRGYYLKNKGALMQLGLMRYGFDKLVAKDFTPMIPPVLDLPRSFVNTGHFPWGQVDVYKTFDDREEQNVRRLAGTAEVPLASYHQDEVLNESDLPKKYAGFSSCFRREIGSYGKDTRGIYRVHEFMKIEQVVLDVNDVKKSRQWLEDLTAISEEILQELGLPYRVLLMCTGEMGEPQFRKYDIETWMPSRKNYGETHSASAMLDFQSRRANIRYRAKDGSTKFVHMLNNTMIASPRILIALWENHQQKDGSINIPSALKPYLGFDSISSK